MTDVDTLSLIVGGVFGFSMAILLRGIEEIVDSRRELRRSRRKTEEWLAQGAAIVKEIEELRTGRHRIDPPKDP